MPVIKVEFLVKSIRTIFTRKPRECPKCQHVPIATILYGDPVLGKNFMLDMAEGKIAIGGCEITIGEAQPAWQCSQCKLELYRKKDIEQAKADNIAMNNS